jgi:hypothetical protein
MPALVSLELERFYSGTYGHIAKLTLSPTFSDSILSVIAASKLVTKEVSDGNHGHMLQLAGYQQSSISVPAVHITILRHCCVHF